LNTYNINHYFWAPWPFPESLKPDHHIRLIKIHHTAHDGGEGLKGRLKKHTGGCHASAALKR